MGPSRIGARRSARDRAQTAPADARRDGGHGIVESGAVRAGARGRPGGAAPRTFIGMAPSSGGGSRLSARAPHPVLRGRNFNSAKTTPSRRDPRRPHGALAVPGGRPPWTTHQVLHLPSTPGAMDARCGYLRPAVMRGIASSPCPSTLLHRERRRASPPGGRHRVPHSGDKGSRRRFLSRVSARLSADYTAACRTCGLGRRDRVWPHRADVRFRHGPVRFVLARRAPAGTHRRLWDGRVLGGGAGARVRRAHRARRADPGYYPPRIARRERDGTPGLAIGLVVANWAEGLLYSFLFGYDAVAPLFMAGAVVALFAATVLAGIPPALRAARVNPVDTLRSE